MDVRSDERSAALAELECAPVHVVVSSAHPRLMPLLIELRPPLGQPGPNGHPILPPLLPLVAERTLANAQGAFLLEDGRQLLLWIGRAAPPAFLLDVFARCVRHASDTRPRGLRAGVGAGSLPKGRDIVLRPTTPLPNPPLLVH